MYGDGMCHCPGWEPLWHPTVRFRHGGTQDGIQRNTGSAAQPAQHRRSEAPARTKGEEARRERREAGEQHGARTQRTNTQQENTDIGRKHQQEHPPRRTPNKKTSEQQKPRQDRAKGLQPTGE
eukprot:gene1062-biopygen2619